MSCNYLKYSLFFVVIILIITTSSCTKGHEPVPVVQVVPAQNDSSFMREGDGDNDEDTDMSVIGAGVNQDDDSVIGGDDNEDDDDVDVVGSDVVVGDNAGGLGSSVGSAGGRGGN